MIDVCHHGVVANQEIGIADSADQGPGAFGPIASLNLLVSLRDWMSGILAVQGMFAAGGCLPEIDE